MELSIINNDHKKLIQYYLEQCQIENYNEKKITDFLSLLLEKNEKMNLISRQLTVKTIIEEHIYDCLSAFHFFNPYQSITDLGSGGGFPGLLLAVIFPAKKITLIEKSPKKVLFLKKTAQILKLSNTTILEKVINNEKISSQVITCRAFKSINQIIQLTKDYFEHAGQYILYKGKKDTILKEINMIIKPQKVKYQLYRTAEKMKKERHIILLKKRESIK